MHRHPAEKRGLAVSSVTAKTGKIPEFCENAENRGGFWGCFLIFEIGARPRNPWGCGD